jgi:hypothetical protein
MVAVVSLALYPVVTLITGDFIKALALKLYGFWRNLTKPKAA